MRYLLDTNTCIAAMRNHPKVVSRLAATAPADCAISTIVIFELYTGVEKSAQPVKERAKVETLIQNFPDLPFDMAAAMEAAWVRALVLVSANVKEFSRVPGLTVENWQV